MKREKIVRTVTGFAPYPHTPGPTVHQIADVLVNHGYEVQTRRVCLGGASLDQAVDLVDDPELLISVGTLDRETAVAQLDTFLQQPALNFNLDITAGVSAADVALLFAIMQQNATRTFGFTYVVNNVANAPFFPAATFGLPGFALGLQTPNLSVGCETLADWFDQMRAVWTELIQLLGERPDFLGIDSSVAPIFDGAGSLVRFIRQLEGEWSTAVTSDSFIQITRFIQSQNPRPVGLCGLMLPCLEDFELAAQYEAGQFTIERNLFLALHSGLGIDTYPIGMDESPVRVLQILSLLRALSLKYNKPLSARFVADGQARIGEPSQFNNPYLKDVVIRPL